MEKAVRIVNKDVYSDLEQEIYDLRQLSLKLKLLDEYRGNTGDDLAVAAISFDIDELFSMAESIAVLFNQISERIITPSESV